MRTREAKKLFRSILVGLISAILLCTQPLFAQEKSCGIDLFAELEQQNPAAARQIRDEAKATPNGQGLLWKIVTPRRKPSYLFGTMHMSDERIINLPQTARQALDNADTVVIETTDVLDRSIVTRAFAERPDLIMFPEGESLMDHLTEAEQAELGDWLKTKGVQLQSVIKMKPWMILSLVSVPDCEKVRQTQGKKILDILLAEEAKASGKQLVGLESMTEQYEAFNAFALNAQVRALFKTATQDDVARNMPGNMIETLISLYVKGETGMFIPATLHLVPHDADELDEYDQFERHVVVQRNHVMAERAKRYLDQGGAFIAIGALHLPGKEGVVQLLREQGLSVERAD